MNRAWVLLCLWTSACTVLDFDEYWPGQSPLPSFDSAPRWSHPSHTARTRLHEGSLRFHSTLPRRIERCISLTESRTDCTDEDNDGLTDLWEESLLYTLRPVIQMDEFDRTLMDRFGAEAIGRVYPAPDAPDRIRMLLVFAYDRDYGSCGISAHHGDLERVALDLVPSADDPELELQVRGMYSAAHEYTTLDRGTLHLNVEAKDFETIEDSKDGSIFWLVYASRNKHATYLSRRACADVASMVCLEETCGDRSASPDSSRVLLTVRNAGEPDAPIVTVKDPDVDDYRPYTNLLPGTAISTATRFVLDWSDVRFCGNERQNAGGCAPPISEKLLRDPFFEAARN